MAGTFFRNPLPQGGGFCFFTFSLRTMPKKTAILIDGEFFSRALHHAMRSPKGIRPTALETYAAAMKFTLPGEEEVFHIFYYDSMPYAGRQTHPVTKAQIDYSSTKQADARKRFLSEIGQMDLVALRCGETRPRGWQLTEKYLDSIKDGAPPSTPLAADYELRFEQKGVDMRIGIDVATLSLNRYVERIIVASNDTDLVPAFKVARRHGVQVVIMKFPQGPFKVHQQLVEDSDFCRKFIL
jgi:uncharacterized LabA/DUF88 family protein